MNIFVSFFYTDKKRTGFGNTFFEVDEDINSFDDIRYIENKIRQKNDMSNVILLNWKIISGGDDKSDA